MLTDIDKPLDQLRDLTSEEMCVASLIDIVLVAFIDSSCRENMRGWIEHFTNKYIICGRLVESAAA
jgi:membrane-associated progesterone receptor component